MTELEIMQRAKMYIEKMANGINPLTDEDIKEDDFINNVRISRCLFYVSGLLDKVIANGGEISTKGKKKSDFVIDTALLVHFRYSDSPIALSEIINRLNELVDADNVKKLSFKNYASWLISCNILEECSNEEKITKRPTPLGAKIGISVEQRTSSSGNIYQVVVYNKAAQQFLIQNFDKYLNGEVLQSE